MDVFVLGSYYMWKVGDILDLLVGSYSDVLMDVHVFVYYYSCGR